MAYGVYCLSIIDVIKVRVGMHSSGITAVGSGDSQL